MFAAHVGVERDPPAGLDGLLALTHALRAHRANARAGEDDDRLLVELAGAYLGVLLVRELGAAHVSRAGQHGLRLGRRGFFDPFAAVESALDADDVKRALSVAVAEAEAEARERGPIARVVLEDRKSVV